MGNDVFKDAFAAGLRDSRSHYSPSQWAQFAHFFSGGPESVHLFFGWSLAK